MGVPHYIEWLPKQAPLRLMIRPIVNPVVPAATGVFTHSLFTRPVADRKRVLDA